MPPALPDLDIASRALFAFERLAPNKQLPKNVATESRHDPGVRWAWGGGMNALPAANGDDGVHTGDVVTLRDRYPRSVPEPKIR